jgi:hypothetical protein
MIAVRRRPMLEAPAVMCNVFSSLSVIGVRGIIARRNIVQWKLIRVPFPRTSVLALTVWHTGVDILQQRGLAREKVM